MQSIALKSFRRGFGGTLFFRKGFPQGAQKMKITLNGETRDVDDGLTIAALIATLDLPAEHTVAEHNGEIVPREDHANTTLAPEDTLELIRFVGGG